MLSPLPYTYMYIVYYSSIQWTALPKTNGSVAETGRPCTVKDSSMFPLTVLTCAANVLPEEVHVSCITYHYILPHIVHVRMDNWFEFYTFLSNNNVTKIFFLFLSSCCKQWRWNSHTIQLHIQGRMRIQRKEIFPWYDTILSIQIVYY